MNVSLFDARTTMRRTGSHRFESIPYRHTTKSPTAALSGAYPKYFINDGLAKEGYRRLAGQATP